MNKQPLCKSCKQPFVRYNTIQRLCVQCAIDKVKQDKDKQHRKEQRKARQKLKTKRELLKEAQREFNKYIRLRDKDGPCISCQRFHSGQYHAGHYITVGSSPELRFEEDNCHKQCQPCNEHLSGNLIRYRVNLIEKIGLERVEWLEGPHQAKHYTREQILEIKKHYAKKAKEIA